MAEINTEVPKIPNMFDVLHAGLAKHIDNGVMSWDMDGKEVEFYVEEFVYKGESHIVMMPKAMIDACSDPTGTRGRLMEVWINGLTGLTSDTVEALKAQEISS
ncbi:hypothetical protein LCGC14_1759390 [marine sediment metagenome]|uniref:Uncharacterized protein n=1 Tax=marine sediment metagenome TaxID=412755 RepID=A0A0F9H1K1_9ZZZZ